MALTKLQTKVAESVDFGKNSIGSKLDEYHLWWKIVQIIWDCNQVPRKKLSKDYIMSNRLIQSVARVNGGLMLLQGAEKSCKEILYF